MHHDRRGDDGEISALAPHLGLADRHGVIAFRHFALHLVEELVLVDHHRIGILDGREQHALHIVRSGRLDHLQAWHMAEPCLEALAVLRGSARAGTGGKAHDDRHRNGAAQHVAHLGGLVDDLLHGERREIGELELEDRTHASHGCTDCDASAAQLRDRRIHHALGAEAFHQIAGDLESAAIDADVLAHEEHALIALHGNGHGFLDGLRVAQFTRGCLDLRVHQACSV